jgi:hypothetical protein
MSKEVEGCRRERVTSVSGGVCTREAANEGGCGRGEQECSEWEGRVRMERATILSRRMITGCIPRDGAEWDCSIIRLPFWQWLGAGGEMQQSQCSSAEGECDAMHGG